MQDKPFALRLDEANNDLNTAIEQISSKHDLPCSILALLVSDMLSRLQNGAKKELEIAKKSYEENKAAE